MASPEPNAAPQSESAQAAPGAGPSKDSVPSRAADESAEDVSEDDDEEEEGPLFTGPRSLFVEREAKKLFHFSARIWDDVEPLESCRPSDVRLIHDAEDLYIRCSDGSALGEGETIVVNVRPHKDGNVWRFVVTADGAVASTQPEGFPVAPHARTRFESDARGPRTLVSIPFCEFVKESELGGTPLSGDTWRVQIQRVRVGEPVTAQEIEITFAGGPTRLRVTLPEWEAPFFGVNMVRFQVESSAPKEIAASLTPQPAEFMRAKDPAHVKFRLAKADGFRLRLRLLREPDIETDDPEDDPIPGEASCAVGTIFTLPNIWSDLMAMEDDVIAFKDAARQQGKEISEEIGESVDLFESMVLQADEFRMPRTREKMEPSFFEFIKSVYAEAREGLTSILPDLAASRPMAVEAEALDMSALFSAEELDGASETDDAAEKESADADASAPAENAG